MFTINRMKHCLTFLRHGESEANKGEILQGQINSPLTGTGEHQVRQVAERWLQAGVSFDAIITSPLQRALQTATIVAETLGYTGEIEQNPLWLERSFGELEGKTSQEIRQIEPPVDYFTAFAPVGGRGESQLDLYLRAAQGLQGIIRRPPGRYLVVSHGALIGKLIYAVLGITPQGHYNSPVFYLGNCAYFNISYEAEKRQFVFYGFNNPDEWSWMKGI